MVIKVKIENVWDNSAHAMNMTNNCSPDGNYNWKDIQLVTSGEDFMAIFHMPLPNSNINFSRSILFQSEAPPARKPEVEEFQESNRKYFFKFYDMEQYHDQDYHWNINLNYQQIKNLNPVKTKVISGLVSSLRTFELHNLRCDFLKHLDTLDYYDHYGHGGEVMQLRRYISSPGYYNYDKGAAYIPYKYHFNSENRSYPGYFTEKIILPILFECLTFYCGCPNIQNFIDPNCYILLDLTKPEEALEIVKKSIQDNEYNKRIDCIRREKARIMHDLNPLEVIRKVVKGEV
jgi:hypothetical protein